MPRKKYYLQIGDTAYATGVRIRRDEEGFHIVGFEDSTYHDGVIVEDMEGKPYIEYEKTSKTKSKGGQQ